MEDFNLCYPEISVLPPKKRRKVKVIITKKYKKEPLSDEIIMDPIRNTIKYKKDNSSTFEDFKDFFEDSNTIPRFSITPELNKNHYIGGNLVNLNRMDKIEKIINKKKFILSERDKREFKKEVKKLKEMKEMEKEDIKEVEKENIELTTKIKDFIAEKTKFDLLKALDINNDGKLTREDLFEILRTLGMVFIATSVYFVSINLDTIKMMLFSGNLDWDLIFQLIILQSITNTFSVFLKIYQHQKKVTKKKALELTDIIISQKQEKVDLAKTNEELKEEIKKIKKNFADQLGKLKWLITLEMTEKDLELAVKDTEARKSIQELNNLLQKLNNES